MNTFLCTAIACCLTSVISMPAYDPGPAAGDRDADIMAMLQARLKPGSESALAVGIIDPSGERTYFAGKAGPNGVPPLDGKTFFEIGSTTKVFTAALLAEMVSRGEVALDEPVAKYLPPTVRMPTRGGKEITLLDLATHTSGLPRDPSNLRPKDPTNPYADYSVAQLYDFLSHDELTRDIGAQYEYSNLGMGLLGHALALRAGKTYEALVTERILKPLQMNDTVITLSPAQKGRMATGHNAAGQPVGNFEVPTLAGAGALRSTVEDMLRFLRANLDGGTAGLPAVLRATQTSRHSPALPGGSIGLAWHIAPTFGRDIVWHSGETPGYHSFIGLDQQSKTAVVVLCNWTDSIDDLGMHLLDLRLPLASVNSPAPAVARTEIRVDESVLEQYVGTYQVTPAFSIVVTRQGDQLFIAPTGQPVIPIFAQSETEFFMKSVNAQLSFVRDAAGRVTGLVLHQNGRDVAGQRK